MNSRWHPYHLLVLCLVIVIVPGSNVVFAQETTNTKAEIWTCSMHPQVRLPGPGNCPICSMPLVPVSGKAETPKPVKKPEAAEVWTCSMHPQVRLPGPGNCPICSMPLIPAQGNSGPGDATSSPTVSLTPHEMVMANVETTTVERQRLYRNIRTVGLVGYNDTTLATVTSRVDGYIERLYVDVTGVDVNVGDHLAEIYSNELIDQQVELIVEQKLQQGGQGQARKIRLIRLGMTVEQVDELLRTGVAQEFVTLLSPIAGTVVEKMVVRKSFVKAGDVLFRVANLDSVWISLDIYESEVAAVKYGQRVNVYTEAYPGETFSGFVWFINPILDQESRTVKVLVSLPNNDRKLKPGMFVSAEIQSILLADGTAGPTGAEGLWTCPMHPQVIVKDQGKCPYCQMDLTQIPQYSPPLKVRDAMALAVPVTAVLDAGTKKIAYVEVSDGEFTPVELEVGPRAGDYYPILNGLNEGDRVATRGNFLIDSQAQIMGLPSLFHTQAAATAHGGHDVTSVTKTGTKAVSPGTAPITGHRH